MITQQDVLLTMKAAYPKTTGEEAKKYFEQIQKALDNRIAELEHLAYKRWIKENGEVPGGLGWMKELNRAQMDAENQIRQDYLAELTEIAVQRQLEEELEEANRIDPDKWKTDPYEINVSDSTYRDVDEIWPDKSIKWTIYAGALFETMQRQDKFTPYLPDHEEVPELEALIDEVYEANETDTQKPQQREAEE